MACTASIKVVGRKGASFAGFTHPPGLLVSALALTAARELGLAAGSVVLYEVAAGREDEADGADVASEAAASALGARLSPFRALAGNSVLLASGRPSEERGAVTAAAGGEDGTESFGELVAKLAVMALASPGAAPKGARTALFSSGLASFQPGRGPLVVDSRVGAGGLAWMAMADAADADYEQELFAESTFYRAATLHVPPWVQLVAERTGKARMNAGALYGSEPPSRRVALPWSCEPEVFVRARAGHPGFNAEVKTAGDKRVLEEVTMYVALDLANSLFRCSDAAHYATPPVGFGLIALAHVGYIVSVEWLGVLHVAPVTDPFFLGSEAHRDAVSSLRDVDFGPPVDLGAVAGWTHSGNDRTVAWTARPAAAGSDTFFKLIWADAFAPSTRAARFRHLYEAYGAYARAFADAADPPPLALLPARLLIGQFSVAAEMRFFAGRAASAVELTDAGGPVLRALAGAVTWLARHALLHADIRAPNVLVADAEGGAEEAGGGDRVRVALVDYDDVLALERAPASFAELDEAYRARGVACWLALGALRALVERTFGKAP